MYSREIEGTILTLRASGWSYKNTFVLMDEETGSLWYPAYNGLRSFQGSNAGRFLRRLDSEDTTWADWLRRHPNSAVLR